MRHAHFKSITLITSKGNGLSIIEELFKHGVQMVDLHHARGSQIGAPTNRKGVPIETEQEVVTCIVPAASAQKVFAEVYDLAGLDRPDSGFMYMQDLARATENKLP